MEDPCLVLVLRRQRRLEPDDLSGLENDYCGSKPFSDTSTNNDGAHQLN